MEAKMCLFVFIWNLICEERKIFYAHKKFLKQESIKTNSLLPISMSVNLMDADKRELFKRDIALKKPISVTEICFEEKQYI